MEVAPLRLFFGLPLPREAQEALDRWRPGQGFVEGWCRPAGLHLTLAFLGACPAESLPLLAEAAAGVAGRHAAFQLRTATLMGFPGGPTTRLLCLGLQPCAGLGALATDLRQALEARGQAYDVKPFRPHLTLARFRRARSVAAFTTPPPASFTAAHLVLFESRPPGQYTPLRTWALREV